MKYKVVVYKSGVLLETVIVRALSALDSIHKVQLKYDPMEQDPSYYYITSLIGE